MIEPAHRQGPSKLVPLHLVDGGIAYSAKGEVRLRCTMAEFGQLNAAEATYFVQGDEDYEGYSPDTGVSWPYYAPLEANPPVAPHQSPGPSQVPPTVTVDTVPDQLQKSQRMVATGLYVSWPAAMLFVGLR